MAVQNPAESMKDGEVEDVLFPRPCTPLCTVSVPIKPRRAGVDLSSRLGVIAPCVTQGDMLTNNAHQVVGHDRYQSQKRVKICEAGLTIG